MDYMDMYVCMNVCMYVCTCMYVNLFQVNTGPAPAPPKWYGYLIIRKKVGGVLCGPPTFLCICSNLACVDLL